MDRAVRIRKIILTVLTAVGGILVVVFVAFLIIGFVDGKWIIPFSISFSTALVGAAWCAMGIVFLRESPIPDLTEA